MATPVKEASMRITKNTTISIGLGLVLFVFIFWTGVAIGQSDTRIDKLEEARIEMQQNLKEFTPKSEIESRFKAQADQLGRIEERQVLILEILNNIK